MLTAKDTYILGAYLTLLVGVLTSVYFVFRKQPSRLSADTTLRDADNAAAARADQAEDDSDSDDELEEIVPRAAPRELRAMTRKEIMRADKKKMKADARAYLEAERELKEQQRRSKEQLHREKGLAREAVLLAREAEEAKLREDEEMRKEADYKMWKGSIEVVHTGQELKAKQKSFRERFLVYLKEKKIFLIEEAAMELEVDVSDCWSLIADLQQAGALTGVADDRGKFIVIEPQELDAIADYLMQKGRISVRDLTRYANKIISLGPQ